MRTHLVRRLYPASRVLDQATPPRPPMLAATTIPDETRSPTAAAGVAAGPFAGYPGGKGSAGTAQKIIRLFPPHPLYIELFLGNGAVLRAKPPALESIGIDLDPEVTDRWTRARWPGLQVINACAVRWLETHGHTLPPDALIYADPPYPASTRAHRRIYRCEMQDDATHSRLLNALDALRCSVFVSTYPNDLYSQRLGLWNRETFTAGTRGGARTEAVYWRAGQTSRFGIDLRFVGRDYRERERIKKKAARWVGRLRAMPPAERSGILAALIDAYAATPTATAADAAGDTARPGERAPPPPAALQPGKKPPVPPG